MKKSCGFRDKLDKDYTKHVWSQFDGRVDGFLDEINTNKERVLGIIVLPQIHHLRSKKGVSILMYS